MTDMLEPKTLLRLAWNSILDPKAGARSVLRLNLPRNALWLAFAIVVVTSMLLGQLVVLLSAPEGAGLGNTGIVVGLMQAFFLFVAVHAITHIGRYFGGTGDFYGALAIVVWLQFILILVQIVQLLIGPAVPVLGGLIFFAAIGLSFWLLVNFIAELHGFSSLLNVFVMTIVSVCAIAFALSFILTLLGIPQLLIGG